MTLHTRHQEAIFTSSRTQSASDRNADGSRSLQTDAPRRQAGRDPIGMAATAMIEGSMTSSFEIFNFVTERICRGHKLQQELRACRSPIEIGAVQLKFFHTAVDQHWSEATKLTKLGAKIVQRSLSRDASAP